MSLDIIQPHSLAGHATQACLYTSIRQLLCQPACSFQHCRYNVAHHSCGKCSPVYTGAAQKLKTGIFCEVPVMLT